MPTDDVNKIEKYSVGRLIPGGQHKTCVHSSECGVALTTAADYSIMADHADEDYDGDIFIYRGGRAPLHVTHVRIDDSVDEIEEAAFRYCQHLVQVDTHDGLRIIGARALLNCNSLRRINLKSAVEIRHHAFYFCLDLESVEFGDRLETIGHDAFYGCHSLKHLKLPSVITIATYAFNDCKRLVDIELSERLETIEAHSVTVTAFNASPSH